MKLSEAIRLGSMMKPQCFDDYYDNGGSCAIGAALEAVGLGRNARELEVWPILLAFDELPCPACGQERYLRETMIPHLNDAHRWTRERIADWTETVEAQQEAVVVQPAEVVPA